MYDINCIILVYFDFINYSNIWNNNHKIINNMLSNSLKTSRSKSKIPHNIKSTSIQVLCPIHNQPVHKI